MPYRDADAKLDAQRRRRAKRREAPGEAPGKMKPRNEAPGSPLSGVRFERGLDGRVTPVPCTEREAWEHVAEVIQRPSSSPRMDNLAKLKAIASNLGPLAGEVRLGLMGLTMDDIGQAFEI